MGDGEDFIGDRTGEEYVRGPACGTGKILSEMGQARNMYGAPLGWQGRLFWRREWQGICAGARAGDGEDFIGDRTGEEYAQGPACGTGKILLEMGKASNMCGVPSWGWGLFYWRRNGQGICVGPCAGGGEDFI